jgi:hypothetical protein
MYVRRFREPGDPETTTIADCPDKVVLTEFSLEND